MLAYLINHANPGNKRNYILKRHSTVNNTGRSAPSPWKSLPLAWVNPMEKRLWNNYQINQIHKWMIDSVHYVSENNNCITVNTVLVYILKQTRLAPKWQQLIVTWYVNEKASSDLNTFLCVKTHPFSFIIIHKRCRWQ